MDSDNDAFMDSPNNIGSTTDEYSPLISATTASKTTPLQNLNSLPFNRRKMDQWNNEFCAAVNYNPKLIDLFDQPPSFNLQDSSDAASIRQLQEYFTTKNARKRQLVDSVDKNTEMSGNNIKKRLCYIDLGYQQSQQLKYEIEQLRIEFADLTSKTQMIQKENSALQTRLSQYEVTDAIDRQRTEDARARAIKKDAALQKQRQVIQQVENFLDERPGAVATLRKRFEQKENVATTRSKSKPPAIKKPTAAAPSTSRTPRYPPSVTTISTSSSGSNGTNDGGSGIIYSNARGHTSHRRSQSVSAAAHRSRK